MNTAQSLKFGEARRQREEAARRNPLLTPAPTYVNASMKASYVPPAWSVRQGSEQHLSIKSGGM
jgi:hypothetical protein